MRIAICLAIASAGFLSLPQSASAQAKAAKEEGQICLSVAHGWAGTVEDLKRIRDIPVPASFSRQLEARGCAALQLIRQSLINWHLAYGNEASAAAALAYLERQATGGSPLRPRLAIEVPHDMELAHTYRFVAMEYARAADFYVSPALLAKARKYAEPSLAIAQMLRAERADLKPCDARDKACLARRKGPFPPVFNDYPDRLWRDLDLQLALAGVRASGSADDYVAARAAFARNDDPHFEDAREHAFQYGEGFCDTDDRDYLKAWKEACDADNFEVRALSYWRYRASFSLAAQAAGVEGLGKAQDKWDGDTALRLIERNELRNAGAPWAFFGGNAPVIADIRLGMAEVQFAKAQRAAAAGNPAGGSQAEYETYEALDLMWLAAATVQGTNHPGWLRRIGGRYLAASDFLGKVRDPNGSLWLNHARHLAWFKTILPQLDAMARGEAPSMP